MQPVLQTGASVAFWLIGRESASFDWKSGAEGAARYIYLYFFMKMSPIFKDAINKWQMHKCRKWCGHDMTISEIVSFVI